MILRGGEQFFFQGSKHGVLLTHGFTGTPAEMLLLGRYLQQEGYTVLGIRLAGHGTSPEDMARMGKDDWYYSVCDGYSLLSSCCDTISAVGQSMGGVLSLKLAANVQLNSVAVLAAPIFIHEEKQLYRLPAREKCVGLYHKKNRRNLPNVPDECNDSYGEFPLTAAHELLDLIDGVKKDLPRVKCPLLVVQSHEDHTVQVRSADYIFRRAGSEDKELYWLDRSGHLLTLDCQREEVFAQVGRFLAKYSLREKDRGRDEKTEFQKS